MVADNSIVLLYIYAYKEQIHTMHTHAHIRTDAASEAQSARTNEIRNKFLVTSARAKIKSTRRRRRHARRKFHAVADAPLLQDIHNPGSFHCQCCRAGVMYMYVRITFLSRYLAKRRQCFIFN